MTLESSARPSRVVKGTPFFYGWVVLVVGTLGIVMMGPSQTFTVGLFTDAFVSDLHLSRASLSLIYGLATLGGSFMVPITGRLVDRYGPRRVMVGVSLCFGLACMGMAAVQGALTVTLGVLALRGLGFGSMQLVSTNLISQWFIRRRGFVMGLAGQSLAASLLLYPPLGEMLISQFTWRGAWIVFGLLVWVVILPISWGFFRDRPEQYGLLPDGDQPTATKAQAIHSEENWTALQARHTAVFWVFIAALTLFTMVTAGLVFHQTSLFEMRGLSRGAAVGAFQVMALSSIVGNLAMGRLLDRCAPPYLMAVVLFVLACAVVTVQIMSTSFHAVVYGVLIGLCTGSFRVIDAVVWAKYFGRRYLGSIRGLTMFGTLGGTALGAYPLGLSLDLLGGYGPVLNGLLVLTLGIGVGALFVKPPRK